MAKWLLARSAAAREVFARADEALGWPVTSWCRDLDDAGLKATEVAQPALLATAWATLAAVQEAGGAGQPALTAGHSLGEYTALVAAGALEFETALRLVRRRGELMRDAAAACPGAMAAVLKLDDASVARLCAEVGGTVAPANYNSPGQVVISGAVEAVQQAEGLVKAAGGRAIRLPVSGAFHSPIMAPAAAALAADLAATEFADAVVPVVQNVVAEPVTAAAALRANLAAQVTGCVRWTQTVTGLQAAGVRLAIEFGPGEVLCGLVRRTAPTIQALPVRSADDLAAVLAALAEGAEA